MRPLPYFVEVFRLADRCGLLRDPELAVWRMKQLLALTAFRGRRCRAGSPRAAAKLHGFVLQPVAICPTVPVS